MKNLGTLLLIGSAVGVLMVGCGSDEGDPGGAGSGGKAGAGAGKGGAGGKAGGTGGKTMSSGGKATGGTGGKAGSSSGGQAGECTVEEVAERPLGTSCGFETPDGHSTVVSTCSFADTCELLNCGEPFSQVDAAGCLRAPCESSRQCASGERCVPGVVHGVSCYSSVIESCFVACDHCDCFASADCKELAFCLDADDYPPSADCDLSDQDCSRLEGFLSDLDRASFEDDTADAVAACVTKATRKLADCNGQGGNGGQGGNAGAAGDSGQAGLSGHGGA
jgi:hypothetical protein